jgi:hypothetical protein
MSPWLTNRVPVRMERHGITWNRVGLPSDSLAHALEAIERYGEQVIAAR